MNISFKFLSGPKVKGKIQSLSASFEEPDKALEFVMDLLETNFPTKGELENIIIINVQQFASGELSVTNPNPFWCTVTFINNNVEEETRVFNGAEYFPTF